MTAAVITVTTPLCGICDRQGQVTVPEAGLLAWSLGELAQVAMPDVPAPIREQVMTGYHPACFARICGDTTCPDCKGKGMHVECANDGSHGCSHTNDREWTCSTCDGAGGCDLTAFVGYMQTHCKHGVHEERPTDCFDCRRMNAPPVDPVAVSTDDPWGPPPF